MTRATVMLVDDHAVVRTGFRLLLQSAPDLEVIAEAGSGEEAVQQFLSLRPDVVVMDIAMAGIGGIEATRRILQLDRDAKILALSAHADVSHPRRVLELGARGYLSKRIAPEEMVEAVRTVAAGGRYVDASLAKLMAPAEGEGVTQDPVALLSPREFDVFLQLAQGASVNRIAETMHLSPSTVGTHLYNIKQKLGVTNQAELTLIAVRHGLIQT